MISPTYQEVDGIEVLQLESAAIKVAFSARLRKLICSEEVIFVNTIYFLLRISSLTTPSVSMFLDHGSFQ